MPIKNLTHLLQHVQESGRVKRPTKVVLSLGGVDFYEGAACHRTGYLTDEQAVRSWHAAEAREPRTFASQINDVFGTDLKLQPQDPLKFSTSYVYA